MRGDERRVGSRREERSEGAGTVGERRGVKGVGSRREEMSEGVGSKRESLRGGSGNMVGEIRRFSNRRN